MHVLKIPADRVGTLVGPNGENKKRLEKLVGTTIEVNNDGEVTVSGDSTAEFFLKDVIIAIGRGFPAKDAEKLLSENYMLELIDLREHVSGENNLHRVKARVIGEEGKVKTEIESATECKIAVYGWTVGMIAPLDTMQYARKAVGKIIDGSPITSVFNDLAKYRHEIKASRLIGR